MDTKNKWLIGLGSVLVVGVAASVVFFNGRKDKVHQKPPRKAPQLNIQNPGTQDEFPTSTTQEEMIR
jgi:hypothetical protein